MSNTAEKFDFTRGAQLELISGGLDRDDEQVISRSVLFFGISLAILQVLDGVLTGIGMYQFGTNAEGNALLRVLMEQMGYIPALVTAKCIAIGIIATLCGISGRVSWLKYALAGLCFVYLCHLFNRENA